MKYLAIIGMILWIVVCALNIYTTVWGNLSQMGVLFNSLNIALAGANATIWAFIYDRVKKTK